MASMLGLIFGPLGYFYFGWRHVASALISWWLVCFILYFFRISPWHGGIMIIAMMGIYAYVGFVLADKYNSCVEREEHEVFATLMYGFTLPEMLSCFLVCAGLLREAVTKFMDGDSGHGVIRILGALIAIPLAAWFTGWIASFTLYPLICLIFHRRNSH